MSLDFLAFICTWMLLPLTLAAAWRASMQREVTQPNPRVITLTTMPDVDTLMFPLGTQWVNEIYLRISGHSDSLLQQVSADVDMTAMCSVNGRPSWYQVLRQDENLLVRLWPVPDAQYELCIFTTPGATARVGSNKHGDAQQKALDLLRDWLTFSQRRCFEERGYFIVEGNITSTLYRINNGCVYNVEQLDQAGSVVCKLCFVPDNAPAFVGDIMLAQKIMLENHEAKVLEIANKQPRRGLFSMRD